MKASLVLMKPNIDLRKAVAPDKGAAAFFCSTGSNSLSPIVQFPAISHSGMACRISTLIPKGSICAINPNFLTYFDMFGIIIVSYKAFLLAVTAGKEVKH